MRTTMLAGAALVLLGANAQAADWADWSVSPYTGDVADNVAFSLRGSANGSVFDANQPNAVGLDKTGATGSASVSAGLQRDYDSGLSLSLKTVLEVAHDELSGDNYGSKFFQKVYGTVQTGLGRVEIGQTDGAAYALAVTGPVVEGDISIDNTNASFFRDPSTGQAFINVFALNSAAETSLNYAKISYYTPRLLGVQLGASFTPSEGKDVLPFVDSGPHVPDRQKSIWEAALSYNNSFGPVSLGLSAGFLVGHNAAKTAGHKGLTDWSLGGEVDYDVSDDVKLAVGGAYRQSNAYTFDINSVFSSGGTTSSHLSTTLTKGPWIVGAEIGDGTAEGRLGAPTIGVRGYEASVGYVLNTNLQLSAGWERFHYDRSSGNFYNGAPVADMDAGFVHLLFNI
jgi:hypothetical protein